MDETTNTADVFIGRFQPFHEEHFRLLKKLLNRNSNKILLLIGSSGSPRNQRNPWTAFERISMVKECLSEKELSRITFIQIKDYPGEDARWVDSVRNSVKTTAGENAKIHILTVIKDATSFYQKLFPEWIPLQESVKQNLDATEVRLAYFADNPIWMSKVPNGVKQYLEEFRESSTFLTVKKLFEVESENNTICPVPSYL